MGGLLFTFQRTGQLAVLVVTVWLFFWNYIANKSSKKSKIIYEFIIIIVISIISFIFILGSEMVTRRWEDFSRDDPNKYGSGRFGFWSASINHYVNQSWDNIILGIGYEGVIDLMDKECGARLHTHSDLTDVLLMFGMIGLWMWILFMIALYRNINRYKKMGETYAIGMSIFIIFIIQSCLTGQIYGPHIMYYYMTGLTCILFLLQRQRDEKNYDS